MAVEGAVLAKLAEVMQIVIIERTVQTLLVLVEVVEHSLQVVMAVHRGLVFLQEDFLVP